MDYQEIEALFSEASVLPKYKKKRWFKMQDLNNNNYGNLPIKYNCKSVADRLVNYCEGYVLVNAYIQSTTATPLGDGHTISIKNGSNSIISKAIVKLNNNEVDQNHYIYLTTTYLNLLEYSNDYSENALQYAFSKDTGATGNRARDGINKRKEAIKIRWDDGNHRFEVLIKIPLKYISPFFRRLDFPIINNEVELEITPRGDNCILRVDSQPSELIITHTELYLPEVELTKEYEKQLSNKLSSSFTKELTWDHMNIPVIDEWVNGEFNRSIVPSLNGVRKMYVMAIPRTNWDNQTHSDTSSAIKLENINITIDSVDYYSPDIGNDHEAYAMLQECFNMGGQDYNTGSLISFIDFKDTYRLYAFDLSRQEIFQSDPMKSQTIRLRCNITAEARLLVILSQKKTTQICMNDPNKTRTI